MGGWVGGWVEEDEKAHIANLGVKNFFGAGCGEADPWEDRWVGGWVDGLFVVEVLYDGVGWVGGWVGGWMSKYLLCPARAYRSGSGPHSRSRAGGSGTCQKPQTPWPRRWRRWGFGRSRPGETCLGGWVGWMVERRWVGGFGWVGGLGRDEAVRMSYCTGVGGGWVGGWVGERRGRTGGGGHGGEGR